MRHNINMKSNLERNVSALRTELNSDEFNIRKKIVFDKFKNQEREGREKKTQIVKCEKNKINEI